MAFINWKKLPNHGDEKVTCLLICNMSHIRANWKKLPNHGDEKDRALSVFPTKADTIEKSSPIMGTKNLYRQPDNPSVLSDWQKLPNHGDEKVTMKLSSISPLLSTLKKAPQSWGRKILAAFLCHIPVGVLKKAPQSWGRKISSFDVTNKGSCSRIEKSSPIMGTKTGE